MGAFYYPLRLSDRLCSLPSLLPKFIATPNHLTVYLALKSIINTCIPRLSDIKNKIGESQQSCHMQCQTCSQTSGEEHSGCVNNAKKLPIQQR